MRWRSIFLVALFVATTANPVARAEKIQDGEDVRGPFDLKTLVQDERKENLLHFALQTHGEWTVQDVKRGGFAFRIDSDRDRDFDRYVLVEWRNQEGPGGRLRARVVKRDGTLLAKEPAKHPKPRRLSVWIDRRDLGIEPGMFHLDAYSVLYADRCPDDGCRDLIPDKGRLAVNFGGECAGKEADIVGTKGDDEIHTDGKRVRVDGLAGEDVIKVDSGSVIACGGDGRDVLVGGDGRDRLFGGPGNDEIRTRGTARRPNRALAGPGHDLVFGGDEDDRLFGGPGDDYLSGRGGDDVVDGDRGDDDLKGGPGVDECRDGQDLGGC